MCPALTRAPRPRTAWPEPRRAVARWDLAQGHSAHTASRRAVDESRDTSAGGFRKPRVVSPLSRDASSSLKAASHAVGPHLWEQTERASCGSPVRGGRGFVFLGGRSGQSPSLVRPTPGGDRALIPAGSSDSQGLGPGRGLLRDRDPVPGTVTPAPQPLQGGAGAPLPERRLLRPDLRPRLSAAAGPAVCAGASHRGRHQAGCFGPHRCGSLCSAVISRDFYWNDGVLKALCAAFTTTVAAVSPLRRPRRYRTVPAQPPAGKRPPTLP